MPSPFAKKYLKMPRQLAVFNLAPEKAGSGGKPPPGRIQGMALNESFGAIVAPQMESAVNHALRAALHGKVDIRDGVVQQSNSPSYSVIGLADAPQVEAWLRQKVSAGG